MLTFYNSDVAKEVEKSKKYLNEYDEIYIVHTQQSFLKYLKTGKILSEYEFKTKIHVSRNELYYFISGFDLRKHNTDYIDSVMLTQSKQRQKKVISSNNNDYTLKRQKNYIDLFLKSKLDNYYRTYLNLIRDFGGKNV